MKREVGGIYNNGSDSDSYATITTTMIFYVDGIVHGKVCVVRGEGERGEVMNRVPETGWHLVYKKNEYAFILLLFNFLLCYFYLYYSLL